jgi:hypothetical protein
MHLRSNLSPGWLALGLLSCAASFAQPPAPGPATDAGNANPTPVESADPLPVCNGKVTQFTLGPRGDIDGLILSDGTEVNTPPHLSTAIAYSVHPGDDITVRGLRAAVIPLVQATSIEDHTSRRTVSDEGPGKAGRAGIAARSAPEVVDKQGSIRMSLHGARGEINGALLNDGTVLRIPPGAAADLDTTLLQPGKPIVARGEQLSTPMGTVLDVQAIGPSRSQLSSIDTRPPRGPGPRGRVRPMPPGPDAPPPPAG